MYLERAPRLVFFSIIESRSATRAAVRFFGGGVEHKSSPGNRVDVTARKSYSNKQTSKYPMVNMLKDGVPSPICEQVKQDLT